MFIVAVKQLERRIEMEPSFAVRCFPDGIGRDVGADGKVLPGKRLFGIRSITERRQAWVRAVDQLDKDNVSESWEAILKYCGLGGTGCELRI